MRVFVTGAAGFIGWNLVRLLLVRGHRVTALVHKEADVAKFGKVERVVVGDVVRRDTYEDAAKDADAIVHLALPDATAKYRVAYPTWIEGTKNLLTIAVERGMRSIVHASGAGGMYRHEPGAWVDETAPEEPFTKPTRGRTESDALVRFANGNNGLHTTILRPNVVYGRGGPFQKYFVDYMRRGRYRVVGDGRNYLPFVHVQDVATAFALALERGLGGETFLLADDSPLTFREATDVIGDAHGFHRPGHVPPFLARLVIGKSGVQLITESFRIRNAKAKEKLGWTPAYPTFREGLRSVIT
jgi:nucleoside-diphosphate-sugar epimerase